MLGQLSSQQTALRVPVASEIQKSSLFSRIGAQRSIFVLHSSNNLSKSKKAIICKVEEKESVPSSSSLDPLTVETEKKSGIKDWGYFALWMFALGFGMGPPLDGLHSAVGLQVYDSWPIVIGGEPDGLHTSVWVFPLLGLFYSILGPLQILLDSKFSSPGQLKKGSWTAILTSVGVLIGLLRLSSRLYESEDWSPSSIFGILFICAHGNWYAFDKTWWGYILALFVAVAAPLSEVILMRYFEVWHYSEPDIFILDEGLVSWTSCCYFFYTQWVGSLARCLQTYILPDTFVAEIEPQKGQNEIE